MITIRQIERLFNAQRWSELAGELLANRPEAPMTCSSHSEGSARQHTEADLLGSSLARAVPVAALGMIRLDELAQGCHPLYRRLLNVVLTSQEKDGGWSDPLTTCLCLRALLSGNGRGACLAGGLEYLANLQKSDGTWPREPIRRFPTDAFVTAFILHQLGEFDLFRRAVRFEDATRWFETRSAELDEPTARLWAHTRTRCRLPGQKRQREVKLVAGAPGGVGLV